MAPAFKGLPTRASVHSVISLGLQKASRCLSSFTGFSLESQDKLGGAGH